MSRYIDADRIKIPKMETGLDDTKMRCAIANTPTIDAVPVVRCKDCKWRHTMVEYTEEEVTSLDELDLVVKLRPVCDLGDDGFCSRGEKVTE